MTITAGADDPLTSTVNEQVVGPLWEGQSDNTITLRFSDGITPDTVENLVRDVLMVNGVPARLAAGGDSVTRSGGVCGANVVTVTLASPLKEGDRVSIIEGAKVGDQGDQRALVGTTATVRAAIKDTTRPTVTVIGIIGETTWHVRVNDLNLGALIGDIDAADLAYHPATAGRTIEDPSQVGTTREWTAAISNSGVIEKGDQLEVKEDAVMDAAENNSRRSSPIRVSAKAPTASPAIRNVQMSQFKHTSQASTVFSNAVTTLDDDEQLLVEARKGGPADGALGNGWRIVADVASNHRADKDLDIKVSVDAKGRQVSVRVMNGKATVGDLIDALNGNSDFSGMFLAKLDNGTPDCSAALKTPLSLRDTAADGDPVRRQVESVLGSATTDEGETKFAIEVTFSGEVKTLSSDHHTALLADILKETLDRRQAIVSTAVLATVRDGLALSTVANLKHVGPSAKVRYEATTVDPSLLPKGTGDKDVVKTTAGAIAIDDARNDKDGNQARLPATAVAEGYADDDLTTDKDESRNGASSRNLTQTSSVRAP